MLVKEVTPQLPHEEAIASISIAGTSRDTEMVAVRKSFSWQAPVTFSVVDELPAELTLSVRVRLGHSGTPEVIGFGTLNVKEALAGGRTRAELTVPLSRHHKRNLESETVITERAGDATVLLELV